MTSQQLPAISFCPGCRPDKVKGKWWLRPNGGWEWERKGEEEVEEDMEAAWRELNFALEEVLVAVYYEKGEYDYKARDLLCQSKSFFNLQILLCIFQRYEPGDLLASKFDNEDGDCLRVQEEGTISGRCFVLFNRCPMQAKQTLMLNINVTEVRKE